jgi:hypothetical protein
VRIMPQGAKKKGYLEKWYCASITQACDPCRHCEAVLGDGTVDSPSSIEARAVPASWGEGEELFALEKNIGKTAQSDSLSLCRACYKLGEAQRKKRNKQDGAEEDETPCKKVMINPNPNLKP